MRKLKVKNEENVYEVTIGDIYKDDGLGMLDLKAPDESEESIPWYIYKEGIEECLDANGYTIIDLKSK